MRASRLWSHCGEEKVQTAHRLAKIKLLIILRVTSEAGLQKVPRHTRVFFPKIYYYSIEVNLFSTNNSESGA